MSPQRSAVFWGVLASMHIAALLILNLPPISGALPALLIAVLLAPSVWALVTRRQPPGAKEAARN